MEGASGPNTVLVDCVQAAGSLAESAQQLPGISTIADTLLLR